MLFPPPQKKKAFSTLNDDSAAYCPARKKYPFSSFFVHASVHNWQASTPPPQKKKKKKKKKTWSKNIIKITVIEQPVASYRRA